MDESRTASDIRVLELLVPRFLAMTAVRSETVYSYDPESSMVEFLLHTQVSNAGA